MCAKSLAMCVLVACVQGMYLQFQNSSLISFICIFGLLYQIHCSNPGTDNCRKELFITCPHETYKRYLPRNACNCSEGIVALFQSLNATNFPANEN